MHAAVFSTKRRGSGTRTLALGLYKQLNLLMEEITHDVHTVHQQVSSGRVGTGHARVRNGSVGRLGGSCGRYDLFVRHDCHRTHQNQRGIRSSNLTVIIEGAGKFSSNDARRPYL